jgi:hypothetical protein
MNFARLSGVSGTRINASSNGVSQATGQIAFTRIFHGASSAPVTIATLPSSLMCCYPMYVAYRVRLSEGLGVT